MARPGVTYLEVSNAAQQLAAAGRTPTIETIRMTLGTGSNSTLGVHLRAWKARQDQTQKIASRENLPEELISALKGVWEKVMNQSEETLQAMQQEIEQERAELKQEVFRLQQNNTHWQQQYQQTKQERDGFGHEKSVIEQLLANARIEAAALTEKYAGLEQQNKEKQARIDELRQQNQQIQANLEHYRNASLEQRLADQQRYEQQQKQLEQAIQQINQELAQVRHENLTLQQQYQQVTFENGILKTQLDKLNVQHESMTTRMNEAVCELVKKNQDHQHLRTLLDTLQLKWDEQNKLFIELQGQHAILSQQSLILKNEQKEMHEKNKVLAHEKWMLGQEKAQLYGQLKQLESCV